MKQNRKYNDEKGIALLFTLGILSLLLVLALTFATTTSIDRKAAEVNNDIISARFLADSALERISGTFRYILNDSAASGDHNLSPPSGVLVAFSDASTGNSADDGLVDALVTTRSNGDVVLKESLVTSQSVKWSFVHENNDTTKQIVGRVGYVVVGSGGKLTPQACIKTVGTNEADVARQGVDVDEINIANLEIGDSAPILGSYIGDFDQWLAAICFARVSESAKSP